MNWQVTYRIGAEVKHASVASATAKRARREIQDRYPLVSVVIEDVKPCPVFVSSGDGYDHEDYGGAFDGARVYSDADEGL